MPTTSGSPGSLAAPAPETSSQATMSLVIHHVAGPMAGA